MLIRRGLVTFVLIVTFFVMQTSLFGAMHSVVSTPNLMLILTVSFAMLRGERAGIVTGFVCGLLTDLFFSGMIGVYALVYMYAGYFCARYHRKFYPENLVLPLSMITLADAGCGIVCYLFFFAVRAKYNLPFYLVRVILPEAIFTLIVALVLYPVVLKVNTWLEDIEQRSARKFV